MEEVQNVVADMKAKRKGFHTAKAQKTERQMNSQTKGSLYL